jgi:protein SCO1/2
MAFRTAVSCMILAALAGCGRPAAGADAAALTPIGEVAEFRLTDQDGAPFGRAELLGKVWLVNFFFTSCPSICPLLTDSMAQVAREFADEPRLGFASITVDPEVDDPARLSAYAREQRLPQARWRLLTGPREDIRTLCEASFRLAFGEDYDAKRDISHSSRFVLVDARGRVRGYFDGLDLLARAPLREALRTVLKERE